MAKLTGGIMGGFSGRMGGMVGSNWKGIATVRGYNPTVTNPRTNAQVQNRNRFSQLTALGSCLLATVIKPCWDRFAVKQSGYNLFCSVNKDVWHHEDGLYQDRFKLTSGKMLPVASLGKAVESTNYKITWPTACVDRYQQPSDKCYWAVITNNAEHVVSGGGSVLRSAGQLLIPQAALTGFTPGDCYIYVSFMRADGSIVDSSKQGSLV